MDLNSSMISHLLCFLLLVSLVYPIYCSKTSSHHLANQTFQQEEKFRKLKEKIAIHLQRINKPAVKTIHSPDGDIIDCVLFHNQPAFDHPLLKGHKPASPPKLPKGYVEDNSSDFAQLWSLSGESCPEGTIPIRRTREKDILRAGSIDKFGKKSSDFKKNANGTPNGDPVEYAVITVNDGAVYGAKAIINVWAPYMESKNEFSASKIWITSGEADDPTRNSIEFGWQVSSFHYGDDRPRVTVYWTADGYHKTGCYNLLCPGFIQTNHKIALGSRIVPVSTYNGKQFGIELMVWKDSNDGNWWLKWGSGLLLGYWPAKLFTYLKDYAIDVQFGGAVSNLKTAGSHTFTQMGSGHFPEEGYGKASHFKKIQLVDYDDSLYDLPSDHTTEISFPGCYNLKEGKGYDWGNYFYYGGPGRNINCP
ncbi:protein neprosin-like [Cicer arietinum]|uniref:Uncharacterized protein LOC101515542 n=1 Tax=Cicer arietinum TaxID=3827 RepID=A0A1S2Z6Y1_CICAR|nr:uncharacterized protein LOC101515542 [Cicer arietinum]